jgi:hypothetical protein
MCKHTLTRSKVGLHVRVQLSRTDKGEVREVLMQAHAPSTVESPESWVTSRTVGFLSSSSRTHSLGYRPTATGLNAGVCSIVEAQKIRTEKDDGVSTFILCTHGLLARSLNTNPKC